MTDPLTPEAIERFVAASIDFHRKYVLDIEPEPPERNYQRGEDRHNAVLTKHDVREIRRLGPTTKNAALAAQFNTTETNIEHVLARRTWRHIL